MEILMKLLGRIAQLPGRAFFRISRISSWQYANGIHLKRVANNLRITIIKLKNII
jgi:hypothetical protein